MQFVLTIVRAINKYLPRRLLLRYSFTRYLVNKAYNFLYRIFCSEGIKKISFFGNTLYFDPTDMWIGKSLLILGTYESEAFRFIEKLNLGGHTCIDIGANIGMFTVRLANLVKQHGHVFSFEPNPNTFSILKRNILENGFRNVVIEQIAISNCDGIASFFINTGESGDSHILMKKTLEQNCVNVKTTSIDNYFKNNSCRNDISFIKIDIQGAELLAFEGMSDILKSHKNIVLYVEYAPQWLKQMLGTPRDFFDYLHNLDFDLYIQYNNCETDDLMPFFTIEQIETLPQFKKNPICNIICSRNIEALGRNKIKK